MTFPMTECPSCGEDVPRVASVCKHCFHDLTERPAGQRGGPLMVVLAAGAGMALVGALVLGYVVSIPVEERILVDQDTRSVVWTRQYRAGVSTDRLAWDEIAGLEYVILRAGGFEIAAVTPAGERFIIHEGKAPLKSEAQKYAQLMSKPLQEIDETRGFHKMD